MKNKYLIILGIVIVLIIAFFFVTSKCPSGYSLQDNQCIKTDKKEANGEPGCRDGYELVQGKCTRTLTVRGKVTYSCPKDDSSHYTLGEPVLHDAMCEYEASYKLYNPSDKCITGKKRDSTSGICYFTLLQVAERVTECEPGFVPDGINCVKQDVVDAITKYSCEEGYTLVEKECQKELYERPGIYLK